MNAPDMLRHRACSNLNDGFLFLNAFRISSTDSAESSNIDRIRLGKRNSANRMILWRCDSGQ
jgi:hypothetical protein